MQGEQTKILIIEDEQFIRENIQELLEAKGYFVRTAINGQQGVEEAVNLIPHIIICDVMMPKMDGFKVLEYVRKTPILQNVPFIFLTAKVDKTDIRIGMDLGADDYLTKPFSSRELIAAIETRLKRYNIINSQYNKGKQELDTNVFATYYHEFKTPLHGIIGGLNLLINSTNSFNEAQVKDLQYSILKSAIRLNHSLGNLMLFEEISRAELHTDLLAIFSNGKSTGQWHFKLQDVILARAKEIYDRDNDIQMQFHPVDIAISQEYLQIIVLEAIDNALKFSTNGTAVVVKGFLENNNYTITIEDIGIGFLIQSINDIAPFKQFNRKKYEQQGLGIGLHLIKQLIAFNNGSLQIETAEQKGTKLVIQLPIV